MNNDNDQNNVITGASGSGISRATIVQVAGRLRTEDTVEAAGRAWHRPLLVGSTEAGVHVAVARTPNGKWLVRLEDPDSATATLLCIPTDLSDTSQAISNERLTLSVDMDPGTGAAVSATLDDDALHLDHTGYVMSFDARSGRTGLYEVPASMPDGTPIFHLTPKADYSQVKESLTPCGRDGHRRLPVFFDPRGEHDNPHALGPRRYRKRPVEVDAMLWPGGVAAAGAVIAWCAADGTEVTHVATGAAHPLRRPDEYADGTEIPGVLPDAPEFLVIPTLEGDHRADVGDFIIQGVHQEFYPCKPDIFTKTYETVGTLGTPTDYGAVELVQEVTREVLAELTRQGRTSGILPGARHLEPPTQTHKEN